MILRCIGILVVFGSAIGGLRAQGSEEEMFAVLNQFTWKPILTDAGREAWENHWTLDGERAVLKNDDRGLLFCAGPIAYDNGSHAVLWTKQHFSGAVKVTFEYTKMDDIDQFVNIIYIQATGIGTPPYEEDISQWDSLRTIPTMSKYFRYMNAFHISFAAFEAENNDPANDYVRARRYPVAEGANFSTDTALKPDYKRTGLFKPGIAYTITVIKKDNHLFMQVKGSEETTLFYWNTADFPPIEGGRVGFRHMYTRCARYANITVSGLE